MIETVLCIDDDALSLMVYERTLKSAEFANDVITAQSGKEALAWFSDFFSQKKSGIVNQAPPSLIFLDLVMPRMNGWQFMEEYAMKYADRLPDTKVVIVASSIAPSDFAMKNKYNMVIDFIHKPFTIENLEDLMDNDELGDYFQVHG